MDSDFFSALLSELSQAWQVPDLHPDRNNTCMVHLRDGLDLWMQTDEEKRVFIVLADLGRMPSGAQRTALYRAALKDNGKPPPRNGVFAYSREADSLVLFKLIPLQNLRGDQIADALAPLIEKANLWRNAMANGEIPSVDSMRTSDRMGLFGLRP